MNPHFPYHFIAIEGNIGAGKTTLSQMLAQDFDCQLLLERFVENPFLASFYANPERYALSVELYFMMERHEQLQAFLLQKQNRCVIADYFFIKTLLFAQYTLKGAEYELFERLFHLLNTSFPAPDLLVYLHRPVAALLANIQKRNRDFEKSITIDYLNQIEGTYFEYFERELSFPVLILEVAQVDFQTQATAYRQLITHLRQTYAPGVHRIKIS